MISRVFDLGYELTLLPINSEECVSENSMLYETRVDKIKDILAILNLKKVYSLLKVFERISKVSDVGKFLKENYDKLNSMRDKIQILVHSSMKDQIYRSVFMLGVAIGQIQLYSVGEVMSEESKNTFLITQSLISDLKSVNDSFQTIEDWLAGYNMDDFIIPMGEKEVLDLKRKVQNTLIKM